MEEKTEWMVREGGHKRYKNNNNSKSRAESAEPRGWKIYVYVRNAADSEKAKTTLGTEYTTFPFTFLSTHSFRHVDVHIRTNS